MQEIIRQAAQVLHLCPTQAGWRSRPQALAIVAGLVFELAEQRRKIDAADLGILMKLLDESWF